MATEQQKSPQYQAMRPLAQQYFEGAFTAEATRQALSDIIEEISGSQDEMETIKGLADASYAIGFNRAKEAFESEQAKTNPPKPEYCQECGVRSKRLHLTQVDSFGRRIWLCGKADSDCRSQVQDY